MDQPTSPGGKYDFQSSDILLNCLDNFQKTAKQNMQNNKKKSLIYTKEQLERDPKDIQILDTHTLNLQ